jgi:hypothetical protein
MVPLGFALALLNNGYSPIPLRPNDGKPALSWPPYRDRPMTWEALRRFIDTPFWAEGMQGSAPYNMALVGGYRGLVIIDVDTDGPAILAAMRKALPMPVVVRRCNKGCAMFFRAVGDQIGAIKNHPYMAYYPAVIEADGSYRRLRDVDGKSKPLVENKTNGNITIPPSIHSKTGKLYIYVSRLGLLDVTVLELSNITIEHIVAMEKALEPWCPLPPKLERPANADDRPVPEKRMQAVAEGALAHAAQTLPRDNNSLVRTSRWVGKFVHHGYLAQETVETALMAACEANGLVKQDSAKQCLATIRSGIKRAAKFGDPLPALEDRTYR